MTAAFRWVGALLFLASLGYFLFAYLMQFGVPVRGGDTASAVTSNVMLFTVFAIHHSVFARERVRAVVSRLVPHELERSLYVWIASLLFLLVCAWWRPVNGVAWRADGALLWLLRLLQAAGLWLAVGSASILDVWELAGIRRPEGLPLPMSDDSKSAAGALRPSGGTSTRPAGVEFKTSGPYGWVRHPIYLGWFLFVFAASPMTMTRLVFAIASGVYLLVAIPFEERSMRASAQSAYDRYRAQVPWRLVPGIY